MQNTKMIKAKNDVKFEIENLEKAKEHRIILNETYSEVRHVFAPLYNQMNQINDDLYQAMN